MVGIWLWVATQVGARHSFLYNFSMGRFVFVVHDNQRITSAGRRKNSLWHVECKIRKRICCSLELSWLT